MSGSILFISNGYGEDTVAAHLAEAWRRREPSCDVAGFPTIGDGSFYRTRSIPLAGRGADLPSEGFVRTPRAFLRDLSSGFLRKTWKVGRDLSRSSRGYRFLVVVGDPYLLLFTALWTPHGRERRIFLGVQQSEWYGSKKPFKQHYSGLERLWMRWWCGLALVRDLKTLDYLASRGLDHVRCTGNPMMDCFSINEITPLPAGAPLIGVLPGSRREAYDNLPFIFDVITAFSRRRGGFIFAFALSPHLDEDRIAALFGLERAAGSAGLPGGGEARGGAGTRGGGGTPYREFRLPGADCRIILSTSLFGDIISRAVGVIGMSGTGNEQAAGLGKPVFASWGGGPQITEAFMRAQKRLLGPSLFLLPPHPEAMADTLLRTLDDPALLQTVKKNGEKRMRGRGSIREMVTVMDAYIRRILPASRGEDVP